MTVRDEEGSPLNANVTSAIQLFRQHLLTNERLEKAAVVSKGNVPFNSDTLLVDGGPVPSTHHTYSLLLSCEKINWK